MIERASLESKVSIAGIKGKVESGPDNKKTVHLKDAFNIFQKLRGSPKYWQTAR